MSKVRILQSCAGNDFSYAAKQVVEENEHTQGLINGGLAEWVEKPDSEADETAKTEEDTETLTEEGQKPDSQTKSSASKKDK